MIHNKSIFQLSITSLTNWANFIIFIVSNIPTFFHSFDYLIYWHLKVRFTDFHIPRKKYIISKKENFSCSNIRNFSFIRMYQVKFQETFQLIFYFCRKMSWPSNAYDPIICVSRIKTKTGFLSYPFI